MITIRRPSKCGTLLLGSFLALLFLFASCSSENATDESPVATSTPTQGATAEPPSPAAREAVVDAASLVDAWVRERNRFGDSVRIELEEETSLVNLPGLSLYRATPLIPDMLDENCAVYKEKVWCFREALQNIARQYSLGTDPGQLTDEEWPALIGFFTGTVPLAGPDDLDRLDQYIPDDERAKITAPMIAGLQSGGVRIAFFYEEVDHVGYPSGPMALRRMEVVITGDDILTIEREEIWLNPGDFSVSPTPEC